MVAARTRTQRQEPSRSVGFNPYHLLVYERVLRLPCRTSSRVETDRYHTTFVLRDLRSLSLSTRRFSTSRWVEVNTWLFGRG